MRGGSEEMLDRMDRVVAQRVLCACAGYPDSRAAVVRLLEHGFSFSSAVGVLLASGCPAPGEYVCAKSCAVEHGALAAFLFGEAGAREMHSLDPKGALFGRMGRVLYRRRRMGRGPVRLLVHPAMHSYVRGLLPRDQRGGGGEQRMNKKELPPCVKGRGKVGSYVFAPEDECIADIVPSRAVFFCALPHGPAGVHDPSDPAKTQQCGTRTWLRSAMAGALLKVNEKDSDTATEMAANEKVHAWLSRKHFEHLAPLHPEFAGVAAYSEGRARIKTMIALRPMAGDISKAALSVTEIAQVAKACLLVLYVMHENDYLHLDIKPKNILYESDVRPGGEAGPEAKPPERKFALADFGIIDPMRDVYKEAVLDDAYRGTYGYMSPLIIRDDAENEVYRIFRRVAREVDPTVAAQIPDDDAVERLVEAARREARARITAGAPYREHLAKIDLHSLGFTLYDVLRKQPEAALPAEERLHTLRFISRLLFFGAGDFFTAAQALDALCHEFWPGACPDVGFGESGRVDTGRPRDAA